MTGYAIVLSAFTALSLGAIEGLNQSSEAYLTNTSNEIAQPRDLGYYDELDVIPDLGDGGGGGVDDPTDFDFEFHGEEGQFKSPADQLCITVEPDGRLRQRACDGSPEQKVEVFTDDATKTSQLKINGLCIGIVGDSEDEGADYEMQTCDEENLKQLFRRNGLRWESGSNRDPVQCLDISGGGGEGNVLHQWGCHDQDNQDWPDPALYVPPTPTTPPTPLVTGGGIFVGPIPDGADLSPDADYEDNDNVFVFEESVQILDSDFVLDGTTIPAGTQVCSYIIWYSPVTNSDVVATIDFGAPILGGALSRSELEATAAQFGKPGVNYAYNRSWENNDGFGVNGNVLDIDPYAVSNNGDMLRVFTQCG